MKRHLVVVAAGYRVDILVAVLKRRMMVRSSHSQVGLVPA